MSAALAVDRWMKGCAISCICTFYGLCESWSH
jgi:hypothetical protein